MRIVYMGSPAAVVIPLMRLLAKQPADLSWEVVAVVSQPARPFGRKGVLTDPPLALMAKERGLVTLQPEKASSPEFLTQLKALRPDVIITAAYGQILSDEFLKIPTRAVINLHPSLLPRHRGAIPVQQALLEGDTLTGMSILFTVKKLDAGAIILQQASPILPEEKSEDLLLRMFQLGADMLPHALHLLQDPTFKGTPQDETQVTHCKKISKEDALVRWEEKGAQLFNRFRAYSPWPGCYSFLEQKRVVLEDMEILPASAVSQNLAPGHFILDKVRQGLVVGTGKEYLLIKKLKPEGSKSQDALAFCNGRKSTTGVFVTPSNM